MASIKEKIKNALRMYNRATRVKTLQTMEEIEANTESNCLAGAGAVAELNNKLAGVRTYVDDEGKLHSVDGTGADTVLNFSSDIIIPLLNGQAGGIGSASYAGHAMLTINVSNYRFLYIGSSNAPTFYVTKGNSINNEKIYSGSNPENLKIDISEEEVITIYGAGYTTKINDILISNTDR